MKRTQRLINILHLPRAPEAGLCVENRHHRALLGCWAPGTSHLCLGDLGTQANLHNLLWEEIPEHSHDRRTVVRPCVIRGWDLKTTGRVSRWQMGDGDQGGGACRSAKLLALSPVAAVEHPVSVCKRPSLPGHWGLHTQGGSTGRTEAVNQHLPLCMVAFSLCRK